MRKRFAIVGVGLAVVLVSATPAAATSIVFDPDGNPLTANNVSIDKFDFKFGNAIAQNLVGTSAPGSAGTVLFQANLNTGDLGGVTQFASCFAGADCFTAVAAISETVATNDGKGGLTFALDPTGPNFFRLYANDTQQGDDLTGNCFAGPTGFSGGLGCLPKTLVLEGTFLNDGSFSSAFTSTGAFDKLDKFGTNNYKGVTTVVGNGSFQGHIGSWTFVNPLYFPSGLPAGLLFDASSQQSLPFAQVNPAACFSADGISGGASGPFGGTSTPCVNKQGVDNVAPVNGVSGPDTMLQTHAGASFIAPARVPEPGMLLLLGFGLVGVASRLRRPRKGTK